MHAQGRPARRVLQSRGYSLIFRTTLTHPSLSSPLTGSLRLLDTPIWPLPPHFLLLPLTPSCGFPLPVLQHSIPLPFSSHSIFFSPIFILRGTFELFLHDFSVYFIRSPSRLQGVGFTGGRGQNVGLEAASFDLSVPRPYKVLRILQQEDRLALRALGWTPVPKEITI